MHRTFFIAVVWVIGASARAELGVVEQALVGGEAVLAAGPTALLGSCSATLVAAGLVVTAAHCVDDAPSEAVFGAERIAVRACVAHPDYGLVLGTDIAFCTLASAGPEPAWVSSCRPPTDLSLVGYGYPDLSDTTDRSERQVRVRVREVDGNELIVGDDQHGACHGDSGGSAFDDEGALAGVISRRGPPLDGEGGADCDSTTVVTAMAPHIAWIERASGVALHAHCAADSPGCSSARHTDAGWLGWLLLALRRREKRT